MNAAAVREAVRAWRAGERPGEEISHSARRRSVLLRPASEAGETAVLVKEFRTPARHAAREGLKRALRRSAAEREWTALTALSRAGAPVPRPLTRGRGADGSWLAVEYREGRTLDQALPGATPAQRRRWLVQAGELVRTLHTLDWVHGDLHLGNLLLCDGGAEGRTEWCLLDLQHATATRSRSAREHDLASLEFSLARAGIGLSGRLRVRRAALPGATPTALRAIGHRVRERERDHARGRTRRSTVVGRSQQSFAIGEWRGLQCRALSEADLEHILALHDAALPGDGTELIKDDARARVTRVRLAASAGGAPESVVVKEVRKQGAGRVVADRLRGSPARRGWVAGHGLAARGIDCSTPLAFAEAEAPGIARRSLLVLEDLGAASWLEAAPHSARPERLCAALVRLLVSLHRQGVDHGDLQVTHLYGSAAPRLIDLEGVRFRRRCSDAQRIRALAELNASLPDALVPDALRRDAFTRYARRLPFARDTETALRDVIARSLARRHRWSGAGCAEAEGLRPRKP